MLGPDRLPELWAHRGAHAAAPENTIAAFEAAIALGADGIELDVRRCASGELLVCHDRHFGRITGRAAWVALEPLARLRRLDLGGGERVPTLDEAIELVLGAGRRLNIEIKGDVPEPGATVDALVATLARHRLADDGVILSAFHPHIGVRLRRRLTQPFAILYEAHRAFEGRLLELGLRPAGVHPHHTLCDAARMRRWRRAGRFVGAWTVDDPAEARRLAALGVDHLITDDIPGLRRALGR